MHQVLRDGEVDVERLLQRILQDVDHHVAAGEPAGSVVMKRVAYVRQEFEMQHSERRSVVGVEYEISGLVIRDKTQ